MIVDIKVVMAALLPVAGQSKPHTWRVFVFTTLYHYIFKGWR
jgi:hypothetical protein